MPIAKKNIQFSQPMFYFHKSAQSWRRMDTLAVSFGVFFFLAATVTAQVNSQAAAAERVIQSAIATDPKNADLHAIQGAVLYRDDKLMEAASAWETAAKLDPNLSGAAKMAAKARRDASLEKNFQKTPREHFLIKYEGNGRDDLAQTVTAMLEAIYREVGQRFQSWPDEAFMVILYTDTQFKEIDTTAWTAGIYDGKIRIRTTAVTGDPEQMKRILSHEYAHALIFRIFGAGIPLWLNEGLAQNSRADLAPTTDKLKAWHVVAKAALLPPWTLDAWFAPTASRQQATMAYLETQFFVRWLLERHDMPTVIRWGKELAAGKSVADATTTIFAMSPDQLLDAWKESMGK